MKALATISACVFLFAGGSSSASQSDPPRYSAPTDLTILKHSFGGEQRFVTETMPQSARGGQPATRVVSQPVMTVSVKVRSNATKAIIGVSWYFVLPKNANEEYFSVPFITQTDIAPRDSKTFKAQIEKLPGRSRAVTVEELKQADQRRGNERIVITCVAFSDGTTSPLNEASRRDCLQLETSAEIRKKIEKP